MKVIDRQTQIAFLVLGAIALALYTVYLPGMIAGILRCGAVPVPPAVLSPLGFLNPSQLGDVSGYGTVPGTACGPETGAVIVWMVVLVALAATVAVIVWRLVHDWRQSDERFIRDIGRREGLAKEKEIRDKLGEKATLEKAAKIRPTLANARVEDASIKVGHVGSQPVNVTSEESIVVVGPPRSGKGFHLLISAILDAPGSVITTSTRADNYAATHGIRAAQGPVILFDPQGLTGAKSTLRWSPITGCERPEVAARRASSLIGSSPLGQSSSNQEWAGVATAILQQLLHAAALGGFTVDDLYQWASAPGTAKDAVKVLQTHPDAALGWGNSLDYVITGDPKQLGNKWFGVEGALSGLAVPKVRETLRPETPEQALDPASFIKDRGTLYLIGTKTGGGAISPFLIAMMDEITETAREMAIRLPGNRLDPPMSLVLDEIANMSHAWPGLVNLMSDGGGVGISCLVVLQSLAQARGGWGEHEAQTIFDSATVKIQLGGSGNDRDLDSFVKLLGTRKIKETTVSHGVDATTSSESQREVDVLTIAELRRIPFGYGLCLTRAGRPFIMKMTRWIDRPDAVHVKAAIKAFNSSLLEELVGDEPLTVESPLREPTRV
jgi:type IV secretory pathway TraG/TraD family ATPase VirD4